MRRAFCLFLSIVLTSVVFSACSGSGQQDASSKSDSSSGGIVAAALTKKTGIADLDCTADFSADAYVKNTDGGGQLIVWKDGKEDTVYEVGAGYALREPLWSPDGKYIAFKVVDLSQEDYCPYGNVNIFRLSDRKIMETGVPVCVGGMGYGEEFYAWSGDSTKLLMEYCVQPSPMAKTPQSFVYWDTASQKVTEVSVPQVIKDGDYVSGERCYRAAFSPNGTKIAYSVYTENGVALRLYDIAAKGRSDIGLLDTKRERDAGFFVLPIVWTSDKELLSGGLPDLDKGGDPTLFRVNVAAGDVGKIDVGRSIISISPTGNYLLTYASDPSGYELWNLKTMKSAALMLVHGDSVWNKSGDKLIFREKGAIKVVGLDGKVLGETVADRIGDSTPVLTGDGVWYEKRA